MSVLVGRLLSHDNDGQTDGLSQFLEAKGILYRDGGVVVQQTVAGARTAASSLCSAEAVLLAVFHYKSTRPLLILFRYSRKKNTDFFQFLVC